MIAVFLRLLAELSFLQAFSVVFFPGEPWLFVAALSALGTAAQLLRGRFSPAAALPVCAAMCALPALLFQGWYFLLPQAASVLYVLKAVYTGKMEPDRDQAADVLSLFWKLYLPFMVFAMMVAGADRVMACSVWMALLCCTASVVLLRTLRHNEDVAGDPMLQGLNLAAGLGLVALPWLCSRTWAVNGFLKALGFFWEKLLAPVLLALMYGVFMVLYWIFEMLHGLFGNGSVPELQGQFAEFTQNLQEELLEAEGAGGGSGALLLVLKIVGLVAAAAAIWLFFRWLAGHRRETEPRTEARMETTLLPKGSRSPRQRELAGGSAALSVRKSYRRFLRLCRARGVELRPGFTSLQIQRRSCSLRPNEAQAEELRSLYVKARYANRATRQEAKRAEELVGELKKQMKA